MDYRDKKLDLIESIIQIRDKELIDWLHEMVKEAVFRRDYTASEITPENEEITSSSNITLMNEDKPIDTNIHESTPPQPTPVSPKETVVTNEPIIVPTIPPTAPKKFTFLEDVFFDDED